MCQLLKQVVTQAAPEPEKVFDMVEQMPTFPGGQQELMDLIVMLAAMVAVPREMIEAAKLENASNWTIFRRIIIPMTSSTDVYKRQGLGMPRIV